MLFSFKMFIVRESRDPVAPARLFTRSREEPEHSCVWPGRYRAQARLPVLPQSSGSLTKVLVVQPCLTAPALMAIRSAMLQIVSEFAILSVRRRRCHHPAHSRHWPEARAEQALYEGFLLHSSSH